MDDRIFIDKKKLTEQEFQYDVFYRHGIECLQKYCGEIWTDYNIHDPGVTIFEQLCYALSELHYKSTFPVEDYFFEKDNRLLFDKLGLQLPERILPNACITINDLRRVLFDEVDEIGNIWIEHHDKNFQGLYTVYVDIADHLQINEKLKKNVCSKILDAFAKRRNLGEDIEEIIILDRCMVELYGTVEIHTMRPAWEVCGEIYAKCAEYVSKNMHYRSVKEMHSLGLTLPELFDGPLLKYGIIPESDLTTLQRMICISEMTSRIKNIKGVVDVYNLSLHTDDKIIEDSTPAVEGVKVKYIKLPQNSNEIHLDLLSSGHSLPLNYKHIIDETRKKLINDLNYPEYLNDVRRLYPLPKGNYHRFDDYYSIQNDFPSVYGISREGMPNFETKEKKAKAKQLKAYLWLFEQIIADMSCSLENIKNLFSTDPSIRSTLFSRYLGNREIADIEELYTNPHQSAESLRNALSCFDKFSDKRNAVLDMMLGIYGLDLGQVSLHNMRKKGDSLNPSDSMINNKLRYLSYAPLLADRLVKGADLISVNSKRSETISGLELQVMLRTGNDPENIDPLERLIVIEHVLLRQSVKNYSEKTKNYFNCRVTVFFPGYSGRYADNQFRTLVMQIIEKYMPAHIFVNYLWCDELQWLTIEKKYHEWCVLTREKRIEKKDSISADIAKMILDSGGM